MGRETCMIQVLPSQLTPQSRVLFDPKAPACLKRVVGLDGDPAITFVERLLEANIALRAGQQADALLEIFRDRGLQV